MPFAWETRTDLPVALAHVPVVSSDAFVQGVIWSVEDGGRIAALFGATHQDRVRIYAVIAHDGRGTLTVAAMDPEEQGYPALTPECPQAHWFEREIFEQWGIRPHGHPWLKPIRFQPGQHPMDAMEAMPRPDIGLIPYFAPEGEEIHEVAVGPVHAGVIEPGHFRFQCAGETVLHLEISLGYQHRGIEVFLPQAPTKRRMSLLETAAGDTTIGHGLAYCQLMETLHGIKVRPRAELLRAVMLELERLANHTGDLGALAGDVGFLPTLSFCGRLRGDFLNLSALLCGSRFGRGMLLPGGVCHDLDGPRLDRLRAGLEVAGRDVGGALRLLFGTGSVLSRFEHTGRLTQAMALELGLVGVPLRACGIPRDVRQDYRSGPYERITSTAITAPGGDVLARARVRSAEIDASLALISICLNQLEQEKEDASLPLSGGQMSPDTLAVSLVEGWRGEICHVALTNEHGGLHCYKIVDPSFHNWFGLAMALRGQQISDFPLCNKSFNLSYCGHDL